MKRQIRENFLNLQPTLITGGLTKAINKIDCMWIFADKRTEKLNKK